MQKIRKQQATIFEQFGTSCDLKILSIANGGQFVSLPLSDGHSICLEAKKNDHFCVKPMVYYGQTNYMIIICFKLISS